MKSLYTSLVLLMLGSNSFGQWQATSVSTARGEIVYDITQHNGKLYGAINSKGLIKYNGTSWDSVSVTGFTFNLNSRHIERIISNSNMLYAVIQDQICASSMIYKSADDGLTFVADTAGLPTHTCDNKPLNVDFLYSDGDYLFLTLTTGSNTYRKKPADASWTVNPSDVRLASCFVGDNSKWYGFYHSLVVSDDFGQTWTSPSNTNIPSSNIANGLYADKINGRIYAPLEIYSNYGTKLVYTEDEGKNWDSLAINQYLTKDHIGLKIQRIMAMVSEGDFIELALTNNKQNTTPDFLVSTDAGISFSKDSVGLPNDQWGTMTSRALTIFNNTLYAVVGADVYKKSSTSTSISKIDNTQKYVLSPNPSTGIVYISNLQDETVEVFDIQGNKLVSQKQSSIDISNYPAGVYFVKIISQETIEFIKVVKNN